MSQRKSETHTQEPSEDAMLAMLATNGLHLMTMARGLFLMAGRCCVGAVIVHQKMGVEHHWHPGLGGVQELQEFTACDADPRHPPLPDADTDVTGRYPRIGANGREQETLKNQWLNKDFCPQSFARIRRQPGCGLPLGLPLGPHQGDAVPRRHRSGQ